MRRALLLRGMAALVPAGLALPRQGRAQNPIPAPMPAPAPMLPAAPGSTAPPPVGNVPEVCAVPGELQNLQFALPRMAALLRDRAPVRILAIGSSSTAGVGATVPAHAYPPRLRDALLRLLPGAEITVRNDGIGGEVASTTLVRLRKSVEDWKPDLVLWQLGTNDAVRHISSEAFAETLREGVDFVLGQGLNLILIDPQYFSGVANEDLYRIFVQSIERVAAEKRVPLMRRYAIMRYWDALPRKVLMLSADGFHMNDLGYLCMAETLAGGMAQRLARSTP
jgi:lysophospholipase L1-like esterase